MCISDRSLYFSAGSVSDLCISVCKWCPGYRENRSAEVPAGNKSGSRQNDIFWNPSNDRSKYLCNCRCHSSGVPIALFTSVFMARYCPKKIYRPLKSGIELMAGVPSIVYGFFGLILIVPLIRQIFGGTGTSMLAACVLLGMMILPTIIGVTDLRSAAYLRVITKVHWHWEQPRREASFLSCFRQQSQVFWQL